MSTDSTCVWDDAATAIAPSDDTLATFIPALTVVQTPVASTSKVTTNATAPPPPVTTQPATSSKTLPATPFGPGRSYFLSHLKAKQVSSDAYMDSALAPKPFDGKSTNLDEAEKWVRYFRQYATYRHLKDEDALSLFKLLLTGEAQDWLIALPAYQSGTLNGLTDAFLQRFAPNQLQRYQRASSMWARVQQPNESVDSFVTAMQSMAQQIELQDEQQLIFCIIRGFKPNIRLHVLQNKHTSLSEMLHSARVAEIAAAGCEGNSDVISELSKTVTVLVQKLALDERANSTSAGTPSSNAVAYVTADQSTSAQAQSTPPNWSERQPAGRNYPPVQRTTPRQQYRTSFRNRGPQSMNNGPGVPTRHPGQPTYASRERQAYRPDPVADHLLTTRQQQCGNCLRLHNMGVCPAYGQICFHCNKANHFSRACRQRARFQR